MSSDKNKGKSYRIVNIIKLITKLKPYHKGIGCAISTGVLHHLFTISTTALCAYMVGLAMEGRLLDHYKHLLILLGICVAARTAMYFAEMWFAHDVAFKVLADFRVQLYDATEKVSPSILLNMRSGQLASTLMSDVELLEWFFAHTFGSILVACIVPAVILLFLGWLNPLLPLIMLVFIALTVVIPHFMKNTADKQGKIVRDRLADANAVTVEGVQGMKEILTLNYVKTYGEKNQQYMQSLYKSQLDYGKRLGTEGGLLQFAVGISTISVMAAAVALIFNGALELSWFPVVVILAGMTFNPIVEVCGTARSFGLIFASANRVFKVLEAKPMVEDKGESLDISALVPRIEFDNVSFRYGEELEHAVCNASFKVNPGETVALVGPSGAGKSTCTNLLMRYWDVNEGAIRIGGKDIRQMSLDNLRDLTSAVLQDVYLFNTSIRENIRLGKVNATDREVEEAARSALAHDFILNLPDGYDTVTGERGLQLSGGQRQRIAIARAVLKGSPILILDEAVSNLDSENEKAIQEALKETCKNRTTLVVAHRLSTIMAADRLVVMDHGKIMQIGSHDELIAREGFYRELVSSQFEQKIAARGL